ncbi:hypothetical protein E4U56_005062 [Claviceps arundinis]|uniref:EKC/KEOPS complex subunit BUD32 n=1 Tax=Claviceps arundinis TaxID=1623583 RepID=A0A9P7MLB7_9HYPO|nr:hypothetical protein E4U56_005062 [Claviceps arundinis]
MEIYKSGEEFNVKDGEMEFSHNKLIIRGPNRDFYYAITEDRFATSSTIDLDNLDKTPIDIDNVWPRYSGRLLRAPSPVPQDSYIKEADFFVPGEYPELLPPGGLVLHEIEAYELLRQHPHPNIAQYHGCVVSDGRVTGLCLAKYKMTLEERMEVSEPFDKEIFLESIECGIRHLHSLGIVHNDISPYNIMLDEMDRPVIIDFDSWQQNGQELGIKKGSPGWWKEDSKHALFENDYFSLSKIKEFLFALASSSWDPLTKSTSATENAFKASTSASMQIGGPLDMPDSICTTPESHVEGEKQNTTTPPPSKRTEKQDEYRVKTKEKADTKKGWPGELLERVCILM